MQAVASAAGPLDAVDFVAACDGRDGSDPYDPPTSPAASASAGAMAARGGEGGWATHDDDHGNDDERGLFANRIRTVRRARARGDGRTGRA